MNTYDVAYLEGEFGRMVTVTVCAEDEGEALETAQEDYYFGKLIHIELVETGTCNERGYV